jgi:Ca2+/Na+ antiporter
MSEQHIVAADHTAKDSNLLRLTKTKIIILQSMLFLLLVVTGSMMIHMVLTTPEKKDAWQGHLAMGWTTVVTSVIFLCLAVSIFWKTNSGKEVVRLARSRLAK